MQKLMGVMALCAAVAACGGGGGEAPAPAPAPAPLAFKRVVFIGNSLTYYTANPAVGWANNWGMASSTEAKDYAHATARTLGVPLQTFNISGLEWDAATYVPHIGDVTGFIDDSMAVVVELGDNVQPGTEQAFQIPYRLLLDATLPGAKLVCLSTWWEKPATDAVIKAECVAHGGTYLYIGDIFPTRKDDVGRYADAGVEAHPHDWSMAVIAGRVAAALR